MSADTYYVCELCGHYSAAPEWPDRCENCRRDGTYLIPCSDAAQAEKRSEAIVLDNLAARREP